MTKEWTPSFKIDVLNVINHCNIKGLFVGSPESQICETLGLPEIPTEIINKKFKAILYLYHYGNIG